VRVDGIGNVVQQLREDPCVEHGVAELERVSGATPHELRAMPVEELP